MNLDPAPQEPLESPPHGLEEKPSEIPCYYTRELFGNSNEILLEHSGQTYRLKITRYGKLLLNK